MPTYDYECTSCGYRFEKFQSMNDSLLKTCPKCKESVRRLISAGSGIIFKGSGFYATDYKKKDNPAKIDASSKPVCPASGKSTCDGCEKNRNK